MSGDGAGRAELVGPDSPLWAEALERLDHDLYHQPAWAELEAERLGHRPAAFVYRRHGYFFLLPLLIQRIPGSGRIDCASPYGYAGPLGDPEAGEELVAAACRALVGTLREAGAVAAFVRFHPLLSPAARLVGPGAVVHHGDTVAVDLRRAEEEIWSDTRSGHRNEINRTRREGLVVRFDTGWRHLEEFVRLYHRTMERVGADESYFFTAGYFDSLRRRLAGHLHLAVVLEEETVAAAGLFFETGGIAQYHLSGTADEFVRRHPTKLLLDGARRWARERGLDWLHLGGGLGGRNDQLFRFKAGFARGRFPFHTWRLILDPPAYRRLARRLAPAADPEEFGGFFPAYRGPG